ncbi:MAG: hypothetical protein WC796_04615 [Candidatus Pacearchaeota archaeon]|jgi:hypothetical protein
MKVTFPNFAIVGKDPESEHRLEEVINQVLPVSDIDHFPSFESFMSRRQEPYQTVLVDYDLIKDNCDAERLEQINTGNQEGNKSKSQIIVFNANHSLFRNLESIVRMFNERVLRGLLLKPGERGYETMEHDAKTLLAHLMQEGVLNLDFPVAVNGAGVVGSQVVKKLLSEGFEVHWFSQSLSDQKYCIRENDKDKYVNYGGYRKLKGMVNNARLVCHPNIERLLASEPAFLVFASSKYDPGILKKIRKATERGRMIRGLYRDSQPKVDDIILPYVLGKSDAVIMNVSNPPECLAQRELQSCIDPEHIVTCSPDFRRLTGLLGVPQDTIDATILGEHASPMYVPEVIRIRGKSLREISRGKGRLQIAFKSIIEKMIHDLGNYGHDVMALYEEIKGTIPYEDAADAVVEALTDLRKMQIPNSLGYYQERFDGFLLGPKPKVDFHDLTFREDPNSLERYQSILKTCKKYELAKKLQRATTNQRQIASKPKIEHYQF